MMMETDFRLLEHPRHEDVIDLNFIRPENDYFFRKHYKQGLRSHILEMLHKEDVRRENHGLVVDGVRIFPRARPLKMLRIFKSRFPTLEDALEDTHRIKIAEKYLPPTSIARSNEFIVEYRIGARTEIVLCGLQEFVEGQVLDPWSPVPVPAIAGAEVFFEGVRAMIANAGLIPDLAGVGNLLITPQKTIKLVDINNILKIDCQSQISLDDKGYPACDKSVEALALLEHKLLAKPLKPVDPLYRNFLDGKRMQRVRELELEFHRSLGRRWNECAGPEGH